MPGPYKRIVYLCGHGGWKMKDGFVNLPKGCDFTFYSHAHKTIYQDAVEKIVAGKYKGWSDDFEQYQKIQNMTLSADDKENIKPTELALKQNPNKNAQVFFLNYFGVKSMTLKELFELYNIQAAKPIHFVWTCCRYTTVGKEHAFGGRYGVNASEDLLSKSYDFRDFDRNILTK